MMGAATPKRQMTVRRDAQELKPAEYIALRRLLEQPRVDEFLAPAEVAAKLGIDKKVVLQLARSGEFDGKWGKAWRLKHNTVRIPVTGVVAFQERHAFAEPEMAS